MELEKNSFSAKKIEEIFDGVIVVILTAMAHGSSTLNPIYKKKQDSLDIVISLALDKRMALRKKFLKEAEEIAEGIVEEINELTTCSKH